MSQELHYTSVPRGLQPGSRGFCVVAATPNLSAPLRERLEGLSGYQQVFPPHDSRAGLNPVVFAHHRLNLGGRPQSVLSRVAFAGLDYTDRSNKYAHHVVIEPPERPAGGPAWLLSRPGFMEPSWSGEPRVLPAGRAVPRGDVAPAVAAAWRSATGDAGWAGALAEAFLNDPSRPAYLIYEPGFDPLPLFAEALALLPSARRWDVDFNTYFTVAPQGLTCAWRGVLAGTPAAALALKTPGALVLDLTRPMGSPGGGPLIHQARTGERPAAPEPAPIARARSTSRALSSRVGDFAANPDDDDLPVLDLAPIPPPTPRWFAGRSERTRTPAAGRSKFQAARLWVSGAAVVLLLLGGGSIFVYFGGGGSEADALIDQVAGRIRKVEDPPPAVAAAPVPAPPQGDPAPSVEVNRPQQVPEAAAPPVANQPKAEPQPPADPNFFHRPLFMDLPELPAGGALMGEREPPPTPTPPLKLGANVSKVTLHQFATVRKAVGEPAKPALELRAPVPGGEPNVWRVGPNDGDMRGPLYETFDLAELRFQPEGLVVAWSTGAPTRVGFAELAEALRDAVLELTTDHGQKFVVLRDLKPAGQPFQLSGRGRPAGERDELVMRWATGEKLNQSTWKWNVRRYRIDVDPADPGDGPAKNRLLSEGSADGAGQSEFVLIPNSAILELKPAERAGDEGAPRTDKISIVLNLSNHENKTHEDEFKKTKDRIKSRKADLDAALKNEPVDQKKVDALKDSIGEDEKRLAELDEYLRKYKWIQKNTGARLSLILGLRLDDGRFLDLARIGTFSETHDQP